MCSEDLLLNGSKATISQWLGRFVVEARRQDGKSYLPRTIHMLLVGLQRQDFSNSSQLFIIEVKLKRSSFFWKEGHFQHC